MADIDFGQLSEALNDKSDRDLRNVDTTAKADAVIDYQVPTAQNNYTWYRLYKSGWVEQGGIDSGLSGPGVTRTINLPITMSTNTYNIQLTKNGIESASVGVSFESLTTIDFKWAVAFTSTLDRVVCWQVSGMAAQGG